jgi:tRNA pseudouridine13 synthase
MTHVEIGLPPLSTAECPGIGGKIKQQPEDFEVEEIPAYAPSGQGDFVYLWIEKRDMGAEYFTRTVARRLNIPVAEVGAAGLKDRRAVTRQMISVPIQVEPDLAKLDGDGIRVLQVNRHTNKLRSGHLHGNRFRILIREPSSAAATLLAPIIDLLRRQGLPNYYGPQRFGRNGETARLGMALLIGERLSGRRPAPFLRKLALSAAQSLLFNAWLQTRIEDGLLRRVLEGDVMMKIPTGGLFVAQDLDSEQARFDRRETVIAGPIFGRKLFQAAAVALERERAVLERAKLESRHFSGHGKLLAGTRRAGLIYLDDLQADYASEGVRVSFALPAGSYATVVLREIMKSSLLDGDEIA